jgi:3' terminal RNA ribose 2'-O-methyltransferase Hen1
MHRLSGLSVGSDAVLLTVSTTHTPATDLGYLLMKHPDRVHRAELAFGEATVVFPEADAARCTAALVLEIDPIGLVRGRGGGEGPLAQYVNDRPYAAGSFLSVAMARVFGTAMAGNSRERQALADSAMPLQARVPVLRSRAGEARIRECFEPLGYAVEARRLPLDAAFPEWGESPYYDVTVSATVRLRDLLAHLYVLIPVLDGDKHYYVGHDEVEKLLDKAGDWLATHPQREWIVARALKRQRPLVRAALAQLMEQDEDAVEAQEQAREAVEEGIERPISLNEQRMGAVLGALRQSGARSVVDLGCGEGRLLGLLLKEPQFASITGVDVSMRALERAQDRLRLDRMPEKQRARLRLLQGSLTYRDRRIEDCDAACAVEVIEHMDLPRLPAFERAVFGHARPQTVVVTTPNVEYNVRFEGLAPGRMRHPDHRFEWTRAEFRDWAAGVAQRRGYVVRHVPIGSEDAEVGAPTQMAIFERE